MPRRNPMRRAWLAMFTAAGMAALIALLASMVAGSWLGKIIVVGAVVLASTVVCIDGLVHVIREKNK